MGKKSVLITGDDGYNSVGIRTLAKLFKADFDLKIAATLKQQSATGGAINLKGKMGWGEEMVEGVDALWVDGTPVDAIEVAQGYFGEQFDCVISGINYGENAGYSVVSSGTFSAAVRAIGVQLAPRAVVFSWQAPAEYFLIDHKGDSELSEFISYPGQMAKEMFETILKNDFYGKEIVNVNFPSKKTTEYKITKPSKNITKLWKYPLIIDKKKKTAQQPPNTYTDHVEDDIATDVGALHKGYITISPLNYLG